MSKKIMTEFMLDFVKKKIGFIACEKLKMWGSNLIMRQKNTGLL